nr:class I SAM-dependent DNA methyltransferase [uncultured Thiodictyon sp.]
MTAQQIDLSQLEGHLWESANILRGPVDAADFKTYIFPLLFFKRICDVWDEEYDDMVADSGDEELAWFPESHRFQIPEDCHWDEVRAKASNVGTALQRALREIEKANPDSLYGVFGDAQWSNKDRLSDALLKDLIEHFSRLPFGNRNLTSDLLGDAYEYLIKKFADATNKKAGEFYTPRSVVRLMIDMLDPRETETIYDPACGTGGMLLAAVAHVKDRHGDVKRLWGKLYGQEKNLTTSAIARMNLFLHGVEDFEIIRGDTLANPRHCAGDRLRQFVRRDPGQPALFDQAMGPCRLDPGPMGPQLSRHAAAGPGRLCLSAAYSGQPDAQGAVRRTLAAWCTVPQRGTGNARPNDRAGLGRPMRPDFWSKIYCSRGSRKVLNGERPIRASNI